MSGGAECREKHKAASLSLLRVHENNVGHEGNRRKTKMTPVITV